MGLGWGGKWAESQHAGGGRGRAAGWEMGSWSNRPLFCGVTAPALWSGVYSVSPVSPLCYPLGQ